MVDVVWVLSVVIEYDLGSKKSFGNCRCGSSGISISGDGNETEMVLRIYFVTRYFSLVYLWYACIRLIIFECLYLLHFLSRFNAAGVCFLLMLVVIHSYARFS